MKPIWKTFPTWLLLLAWVLCSGILVASAPCAADDHHDGKASLGWHKEGRSHEASTPLRKSLGEKDHGDETTGQIAAWLLAAVNLTVALSISIKGINRFIAISPDLQNSLKKFNQFQKKHLMRFHYYGNPLILGVALLHWLSSRCRSTSLPEWALGMMILVAALGLVLKFKLCPKTLQKNVYKLHTQPLMFLALVTVLVIGHTIVD